MKLTYQGQLVTELNAGQLGMRVDVYEQLRQAWAQGHSGDTHQRLAAMEKLAQEPYQAYSAFAGNPYFISLDALVEEGVLKQEELDAILADIDEVYKDKTKPVRKISYDFDALVSENSEQYDLFSNNEKIEKEKNLTRSILNIQDKFGKIFILQSCCLHQEHRGACIPNIQPLWSE